MNKIHMMTGVMIVMMVMSLVKGNGNGSENRLIGHRKCKRIIIAIFSTNQ